MTIHHSSVATQPNPSLKHDVKPLAIEYLLTNRRVAVYASHQLRGYNPRIAVVNPAGTR